MYNQSHMYSVSPNKETSFNPTNNTTATILEISTQREFQYPIVCPMEIMLT